MKKPQSDPAPVVDMIIVALVLVMCLFFIGLTYFFPAN